MLNEKNAISMLEWLACLDRSESAAFSVEIKEIATIKLKRGKTNVAEIRLPVDFASARSIPVLKRLAKTFKGYGIVVHGSMNGDECRIGCHPPLRHTRFWKIPYDDWVATVTELLGSMVRVGWAEDTCKLKRRIDGIVGNCVSYLASANEHNAKQIFDNLVLAYDSNWLGSSGDGTNG